MSRISQISGARTIKKRLSIAKLGHISVKIDGVRYSNFVTSDLLNKITKAREPPFDKLEPLDEHLRKKFKEYWQLGTHLIVDETIQHFLGRSGETMNIPTKSVPKGFKLWVLANSGYVLDRMHHEKGDDKGPYDLEDFWTTWRGFSKTEAVVLDPVTQEGISNDFKNVFRLDNLFTSAELLKELKSEGFGEAGTVRTPKRAREEIELTKGTKKQKARKEENRSYDGTLASLKTEHNAEILWGETYAKVSDDGDILQLAWKDQNVVLFMTTVDEANKTVDRERKRPPKTSKNSKTSRAFFGDSVRM